jgi:hypothetical protein
MISRQTMDKIRWANRKLLEAKKILALAEQEAKHTDDKIYITSVQKKNQATIHEIAACFFPDGIEELAEKEIYPKVICGHDRDKWLENVTVENLAKLGNEKGE